MSQSDDKLRQKIVTVLCLKPLGSLEPGHYLFPEVTISDADLDKLMQLIAAEHARLLFSLRGKMPKDGEYARVDGKPGNQVEQAWDSGWNNATDQAIAAIDAELDRLKETKE